MLEGIFQRTHRLVISFTAPFGVRTEEAPRIR
jgi:hypothetical protein